jgi:gas vesicle protein GvpK
VSERRRRGKAVRSRKLRSKDVAALRAEVGRPRATRLAKPRWNPDPEDAQRSVAQLVLALVEFLRKLMERQAIRRMEQKTLSAKEVESVGVALMKLEETVHELAKRFEIDPKDLNLDLGPLGKLH